MGKICTVSGCPSGHRSDITRRHNAGIRGVSFFSVPKQIDMLAKWSRAIGKKLSLKDVVCELHFSSECVITKDVTEMPDGTLHCIPRDRYRLAAGAVPIIGANTNAIESTLVNSLQHERANAPKQSIEEKNTADVQKNISIIKDENEDFEHQKFAENIIPAQDAKSTTEKRKYSIDDIVEYLQETPLPQSWCWMHNKYGEHRIILTQIDTFNYAKVRLVLEIHANLSVMAHTSDGDVTVQLHDLITSEHKLKEILNTMGKKMMVCSGTEMEGQNRDDDCLGFIPIDGVKRFVPLPRCNSCARLRKNLRRRCKTEKKDQYSRAMSMSMSEQRKMERAKRKVHR